MNKSTIAQEVRRFIVQNYLMGRDGGIMDSDSFLEAGVIDSTGVLELVAYLQETWNINVEDEEMTTDNLDSIEQVSAYVARKLSAGESAMLEEAVLEA